MYFTINTCKTLDIQNNKMFVKSTILEIFIINNFLREEAHAKRVISQISDLRTSISTVRLSVHLLVLGTLQLLTIFILTQTMSNFRTYSQILFVVLILQLVKIPFLHHFGQGYIRNSTLSWVLIVIQLHYKVITSSMFIMKFQLRCHVSYPL